MTAAINRQALATAHARWMANPNRDEADTELEAALIDRLAMDPDQIIESIHKEGTTIVVWFDEGLALALDAYGNIIYGEQDDE